mmetsp:Transcript_9284/g.32647  ORF Transcript_9284/g.32647 Transcript_9284/m.32647 type:complete len:214 (-) Transcript_9284:1411-2052(-)
MAVNCSRTLAPTKSPGRQRAFGVTQRIKCGTVEFKSETSCERFAANACATSFCFCLPPRAPDSLPRRPSGKSKATRFVVEEVKASTTAAGTASLFLATKPWVEYRTRPAKCRIPKPWPTSALSASVDAFEARAEKRTPDVEPSRSSLEARLASAPDLRPHSASNTRKAPSSAATTGALSKNSTAFMGTPSRAYSRASLAKIMLLKWACSRSLA